MSNERPTEIDTIGLIGFISAIIVFSLIYYRMCGSVIESVFVGVIVAVGAFRPTKDRKHYGWMKYKDEK